MSKEGPILQRKFGTARGFGKATQTPGINTQPSNNLKNLRNEANKIRNKGVDLDSESTHPFYASIISNNALEGEKKIVGIRAKLGNLTESGQRNSREFIELQEQELEIISNLERLQKDDVQAAALQEKLLDQIKGDPLINPEKTMTAFENDIAAGTKNEWGDEYEYAVNSGKTDKFLWYNEADAKDIIPEDKIQDYANLDFLARGGGTQIVGTEKDVTSILNSDDNGQVLNSKGEAIKNKSGDDVFLTDKQLAEKRDLLAYVDKYALRYGRQKAIEDGKTLEEIKDPSILKPYIDAERKIAKTKILGAIEAKISQKEGKISAQRRGASKKNFSVVGGEEDILVGTIYNDDGQNISLDPKKNTTYTSYASARPSSTTDSKSEFNFTTGEWNQLYDSREGLPLKVPKAINGIGKANLVQLDYVDDGTDKPKFLARATTEKSVSRKSLLTPFNSLKNLTLKSFEDNKNAEREFGPIYEAYKQAAQGNKSNAVKKAIEKYSKENGMGLNASTITKHAVQLKELFDEMGSLGLTELSAIFSEAYETERIKKQVSWQGFIDAKEAEIILGSEEFNLLKDKGAAFKQASEDQAFLQEKQEQEDKKKYGLTGGSQVT